MNSVVLFVNSVENLICDVSIYAQAMKLNAKNLRKPPYVCKWLCKKTNCLMPRKFYSSKYAHDVYRSVLVDCRVGINQTPESIQAMNDLLVPLIKEKHQSIGHIYATHAEELGCSRRTLYLVHQ